MMRVKINLTTTERAYSPTPWYHYEIVSMGYDAIEPGTILAKSRATYTDRSSAIDAAKATITRKGRGLWVLTTNAGEQPSITGQQ